MSGNPLGGLISNMDPQMASSFLKSLDEDQIRSAMTMGIEEFVVPHTTDIKQAANEEYEDAHEVRDHYESLPEDEQEQEFHQAWSDLLETMVMIRNDPPAGFRKLKTQLRDPWTLEALMLPLSDEENVDDEFSDEMKDFIAVQAQWMGVNVLPEMYEREEIEAVVEELFPEADPEEAIDELGLEKDERANI